MSATNVARTGKRGNICVGNIVSATMCPRLPVPVGFSLTLVSGNLPNNPLENKLLKLLTDLVLNVTYKSSAHGRGAIDKNK